MASAARTEAACLQVSAETARSYPYRYGFLSGLVREAESAVRLGNTDGAMLAILKAAAFIREAE